MLRWSSIEDEFLFSWLERARQTLIQLNEPRGDIRENIHERVRVWGVGLAATAPTTPLMLVDIDDLLGVDPGLAFFDRGSFFATYTRSTDRPPIFQLGEADPLVGEYLMPWQAPPTTTVVAVARPEPVLSWASARFAGASVIRSFDSRARGTVGVSIRRADGSRCGFLTAGHVAGVEGTSVELGRRSRWWRRRTKWGVIGSAVSVSDPVSSPGQPGWDAAVVEAPGNWPVFRGVAELSPQLHEPLLATMMGGVSGRANVEIIGSLMAYGDKRGRMWADSWLMLPSGTAIHGDSGSAVVGRDGLLGILVGAARRPKTQAFSAQYVQDIHSLSREFLDPNGFMLTT